MLLKISSPGWDVIHAKVVKHAYNVFSEPLIHIIIKRINNTRGVTYRVIPNYKGVNSMMLSNYKPVSLLPPLSKIFEIIMYNKLIEFIKKHYIPCKY